MNERARRHLAARKLFGENLRREMVANNYTQAELGKLVGLQQPMINAILSGRIMPSFDRVIDLHDALALQQGELFKP